MCNKRTLSYFENRETGEVVIGFVMEVKKDVTVVDVVCVGRYEECILHLPIDKYRQVPSRQEQPELPLTEETDDTHFPKSLVGQLVTLYYRKNPRITVRGFVRFVSNDEGAVCLECSGDPFFVDGHTTTCVFADYSLRPVTASSGNPQKPENGSSQPISASSVTTMGESLRKGLPKRCWKCSNPEFTGSMDIRICSSIDANGHSRQVIQRQRIRNIRCAKCGREC